MVKKGLKEAKFKELPSFHFVFSDYSFLFIRDIGGQISSIWDFAIFLFGTMGRVNPPARLATARGGD